MVVKTNEPTFWMEEMVGSQYNSAAKYADSSKYLLVARGNQS